MKTVIGILIAVISLLITSGFAAMSVNPKWYVPPWLPCLLFVLAGVAVLILILYVIHKRKNKTKTIQITKVYEDESGECSLVFHNTSSANITNCQARLIDLAFETPHSQYSLDTYHRAEDLICSQNVGAFGDGKILLFKWSGNISSKDLEIIYKNHTLKIGYRIANVPILVLLNVWADNVGSTYAVCKLEDRLGWGYSFSILKTGFRQDKLRITNFQLASRKGDSRN